MVRARETRGEMIMHILEPVGTGNGPVGHRPYRQVVSHKGDGPRGLPVQGEVHRPETLGQGP